MKRRSLQTPKTRRAVVICLATGALLGTTFLTPASAHVSTSVTHLWGIHIAPLAKGIFYTKKQLSSTGTINRSTNPVHWKRLKGVPAGIADGADANSGGDIKGITTDAASGLAGGGTSGSLTLSLEPCADGEVLIFDETVPGWECGAAPIGPVGPAGPQGEPGATGDAGAQGIQGIQGIQGLQGLQGDKGDKGDKGDAGTTSWAGLTDVPAPFADNDDADSGGDITAIIAGLGLSGGATGGAATIDVSFSGTGSAESAARSDHDHDTDYPALDAVSADGTVNTASNPLNWTKLKNVPIGFADGLDADSGGDITAVSTGVGSGLIGGESAGLVSLEADFGTSAGKVAEGNHNHNGSYLRLDGSDVITGKLTSTSDSGVVFGGNGGGPGAIPATGAGARMMWFPARAAFRAGEVTGVSWDLSYVGDYSTAFGNDTKASGNSSTAMGYNTTAGNGAAFAVGSGTVASGSVSTALGGTTTASGSYSLAAGKNTVASAIQATALGELTEASSRDAVATGYNTNATGGYSSAAGYETTASGLASSSAGHQTTASGLNSAAFGRLSTASGQVSFASGYSSLASGHYGTALGYDTLATGEASTAMGSESWAIGAYSTAMGYITDAIGDSSTSMGTYSSAAGDHSTAMGYYATAQPYGSVAIGKYNVLTGSTDAWVATDPLFVAGNGLGSGSRTNALTLYKNGNMTIAGTLTEASDLRLKTDIVPLGPVLSKVKSLQGVRYNYKDPMRNPGNRQIGLIAQNVEEVFPELVMKGADGYLSLSYGNLSAVLIEAVKEQQGQIDGQQDRIRVLEQENDELKERLDRLEALISGRN